MKVRVEYSSQLGKLTGCGDEVVELDAACTLRALVAALAEKHGTAFRSFFLDSSGEPRPTVLVFVNSEQMQWDADLLLKDGDAVAFLSAIAGGV